MLTARQRYYYKNRDKMLLDNQQHYQKNRDEINEKNRTKTTCYVCNEELSFSTIRSHLKTKKHLSNLKKISSRLDEALSTLQQDEPNIRIKIEEKELRRRKTMEKFMEKLIDNIECNYLRDEKTAVCKIQEVISYLDDIKNTNYNKTIPLLSKHVHTPQEFEQVKVLMKVIKFITYYKSVINFYKRKTLRPFVYHRYTHTYNMLPLDNKKLMRVVENPEMEEWVTIENKYRISIKK